MTSQVLQSPTTVPRLRRWLIPWFWLCLLGAATWGLPTLETFFHWVAPDQRQVIYQRDTFAALVLNHLRLVSISALAATLVGVSTGIIVTRTWGRDFLPLVSQIASMGQTFPPVAVLALCVPTLGFGAGPVIVSLFLYGLLPIVRNTIAGLNDVDPSVREAAHGMGLSPLQVLLQVELPLAGQVILGGIRTSVTINIATAAIGSTIGAKTLGDPVIAGLINTNLAYTLQGAVLIGLLAVTVDQLFEAMQHKGLR